MFKLDEAIGDWLRSFHKHQAYDQGEILEVEQHLRDHIEDLVSDGATEEQAFKKAIVSFGTVSTIAKEEFQTQKRTFSLGSFIRTAMYRNYFKTSIRTLTKNPLTSFINIFGLSIAIGMCLLAYAFIDFELSVDRFHANAEEVYLTTFIVDREGEEAQYGMTPAPLASMLKEDFAFINAVSRVEDQRVIMKYEDQVFHEKVRFVDPDFLKMFSFPLTKGTPESLADVNTIILSEEIAIKYFGEQEAMNQQITMILADGKPKPFVVSGIAKPFPDAHIIDFDFLVNFDNLRTTHPDLDPEDWKSMVDATFIHVSDPQNLPALKQAMNRYKSIQNDIDPDWAITSFDFMSLYDLHLRSGEIRDDISYDGSLEGRIGLPVIASLMLLLAIFNYVNIAIVSAAKRLKEIGLRKVIGASRRNIISQFLLENLVLAFFAAAVGTILTFTILLPWFNGITGRPLVLDFLDVNLILFLFAVALFAGIASGIYPAVYVSRFQSAKIFRGKIGFGKTSHLTKGFLALQFIIACIGITGGVMFTQNSSYQTERDWGYRQENVIYTGVDNKHSFDQLKSALASNPDIVSIAGSEHHLGKSAQSKIISLPDRQIEVRELSVGPGYFATLGLEISSGQSFNENSTGEMNTILINQLLADKLATGDPTGSTVKIDSVYYTIIGIVKNFHFNNFYYEGRPFIISKASPEDYQFLAMEVKKGMDEQVYRNLQSTWSQLFPTIPFQGGYQEDVWVGFFEEIDTQIKFTSVVAIIAMILAALGLYGMLTLNISGRSKEFSVRKVLGAGPRHLAWDIFRQYVALSLIAIALGAPIAHQLVTALMDLMYPDPKPFTYTSTLIAVLILVTVLVFVIASQVWNVTRSNPVDGLATES